VRRGAHPSPRQYVIMALLLAATGCTVGWRTPALAPAQVIREQGPTELQVRCTDGSVFHLRDPAVRGDSIVGWTAPAWDQDGALQRRAVAVGDVLVLAGQ